MQCPSSWNQEHRFCSFSEQSKMVAQPFQKMTNPPDSVVFRNRPKWSPSPFKKSEVFKLRIPPFIRNPPLLFPDLEQGGGFLLKVENFQDFATFCLSKPLQNHLFCKENHVLAVPNRQNFRLRRAVNTLYCAYYHRLSIVQV